MFMYNVVMSKKQIIIIISIFIMLFLFLGFPDFWDKMIAIFSGLLIIYLTYGLPKQEKPPVMNEQLPFIDHKNPTNG